jgi:SAM-dependent methyltransferase
MAALRMAKTPYDSYLTELQFQREVWQRKAVLRLAYQHWYDMIVARLSDLRPTLEIGSGCGNFKSHHTECIATDVFQSGPWIDRVVNAEELPFEENELGNMVVFDVIHHLQRPLKFLRQAQRALKPGGRLIFCEPAVTPWSRLVYSRHHEPIDLSFDIFGLDSQPPPPDPNHTFANMGIPELLFWRQREKTRAVVPRFNWAFARKMSFLLYPLTGGFSYRSFVPAAGYGALLKWEDALLRPFANWLTGTRMLVVLEKAGR